MIIGSQKKIILFSNADRDNNFEMARKVDEMLKKCGRQAVICPVFDDDTGPADAPPGTEAAGLDGELADAEMIITFGGDGTILRAARSAADLEVPILGINMGGKGFIAELEVEDLGLINAVAAGDYQTESRMMLNVVVMREDEQVYRDYALNDVVLRGDNKVIDLTLYGDGHKISHFSGDGAVIATPTGSTAYSMAAGGPIVEPSAHNIIVTPICAHALETRSFVLVSDRRVSVEIGSRKHNPAYMSMDGGEHVVIRDGDIVNVCKSEKYTRLVRISSRSFYKKVSEKLGEKG